jgi:hypothetical protein
LSNLESDPLPQPEQQVDERAKRSLDPMPMPNNSDTSSVGSNTQLSFSQLSPATSTDPSDDRGTVEASGEDFEVRSLAPSDADGIKGIPSEIAEREVWDPGEESVYLSDSPANGESGIGFLIWTGRLRKGETLTIENDRASSGTLDGKLPGIPVTLELDEEDFELLEAPSPANRWKRLRIRSVHIEHEEIIIPWLVHE